MLLVGSFFVGVAGREHHAFDAEFHHFVEECADAIGVGAVEERGIGGDAETALEGFLDARDGEIVAAFTADGEIVMLALAVHVDGEGEVFARLEEVEFFLQQEGVGAKIDVFFAGDEAFDDFIYLRMHQRFAAGDGDHRRAAFVDGFEALFGSELFFEDVRRILDFAAAGAGEIATKERLEHQDERVAFASRKLLLEDVRGDRPRL